MRRLELYYAIILSFILLPVSIIQAPQAQSFICGDAGGDGTVNIADASYLVSYIFYGGPEPAPYESGDVNMDGTVNIADLSYLINYIFYNGPEPCYSAFGLDPFCSDARPLLAITNSGDDMSSPENYSILYENGHSAGGDFLILSGATDTIGLSNMYGSAVFTVESSGQSVDIDDCLTPYMQAEMETVDFDTIMADSAIPAEVPVNGDTCHYDIYIDNIEYDSARVTNTYTPTGMNTIAVYYFIVGDLFMDGEGFLCPDMTGTIYIDSILVNSHMTFIVVNQDSVDVVMDSTTTDIEGVFVDMDGTLGNMLEPTINDMVADMIPDMEADLANQFDSITEPLLEDILVP